MTTTDPDDTYDIRYVGFVDILGFENLVREADINPERRQELVRALETVRRQQAPQLSPTDLQVQIFSDSLIVSTKNTSEGLWHLLLSLQALAWNLLRRGVLVRGGVALGGTQHDDQIVFGVGVVNAYHLESTVAKYPRIVLSRDVAQECLRLQKTDPIYKEYFERLQRDTDGVMFIHYLYELAKTNTQYNRLLNADETALILTGQLILEIIQSALDTTLDEPSIYEKYRWFGNYWNSTVSVDQTRYSTRRVGKLRLAGMD